MTELEILKQKVKELARKYSKKSNLSASWQVINTLGPYLILFYLSLYALQQQQYVLLVGTMCLLILFIVRAFMVMHDCGHACMFRTRALNKVFGFVAGVVVGMPQFVWSKHHSYHHTTNGNWQLYRGPLSTLSVEEYDELSPAKQRVYRYTRHILFSIIGAFLYFIFTPRFNWLLGTLKWVLHIVVTKIKNFRKPIMQIIGEYQSPHWKDASEFRHMAGNNVVLLSIWFFCSIYFGAGIFFTVYLVSLTLAGAIGLLVFTIQHNFEHSYAHESRDWNFFEAAIQGTSFLTVPAFFHWFGLNISYHHIHHLSPTIPNYNLAKCHEEYKSLFTGVKRIRLRDVPGTMKNILWETKESRIITIKEYEAMKDLKIVTS